MTNFIKIFIIIVILLGISTSKSKAQNLSTDIQKKIEKQAFSIMKPNFDWGFMKDTVALLAINFKLNIAKDKNGRARVTRIEANDTLGYKLFPNYKRLSTINFQGLMGAEKNITFMIPILVYNLAEYSKYAEHQDKHGRTLIDMRATINAINALYSTMPYNNLTQGRHKEKEIHPIKSKIIYSELWTVEFMNIR